MRTPRDTVNECIIRMLNPLVVVDFSVISAFLHANWAVNSHAQFHEFDVSVFKAILSIQTLRSHNKKSQLIMQAEMQIRIWYRLQQLLSDSLFQIIDSLNTI